MNQEFTPEQVKIIERVRKLLALGGKSNPNPEEAASATAKAQELLSQYNLELSTLERSTGTDGARENNLALGGMHAWQRKLWRAGRRFMQYIAKGQRPVVFHLGDHDPSGIDMTRDNRERLSMFAGTPIQVVRLGLNINQVEQYRPPPNPTKITDSRAAAYITEFGDESWELDALSPEVIERLIEDAVTSMRDARLWDAALEREATERDQLDALAEDL